MGATNVAKKRRLKGKFGKPHGRHSYLQRYYFQKQTVDDQSEVQNSSATCTQPHIDKYIITSTADLKMSLKRVIPIPTSGEHKHSKYSVSHCEGEDLKMLFMRKPTPHFSGYRLIDVQLLNRHINRISMHIATCDKAKYLISLKKDPFQLLSDCTHRGLAVKMSGKCLGCNFKFNIDSSEKIETTDSQKRYDVNVRSVWGAMVTGGGCSSLNELCGTIDMPSISRHSFSAIEHEIGKLWENVLFEELLEAGAVERKLAVERNDFYQNIPAITVVCDGGWSKRSHRHTYNAMGGVAVIFGAETSRLLFIGVRNKYCSICAVASHKNQEPRKHNCFKNWTKSSQAMEADIILEGFQTAEKMHGLRYMRMIGDGDSSVYAKIQEHVPIWGKAVTKVECANHICKCLRTKLEQLVSDNPSYKGKNKLTKAFRIRLVATVRSSIAFRCKHLLPDKRENVKLLQHDIRNSINHLFGHHGKCSSFCKYTPTIHSEHTASTSDITSPSDVSQENEEMVDDPNAVLSSLTEYWTEGMSITDLENARVSESSPLNLDQDIYKDVYILLDKLSVKADRLLCNATTNLAENWMNIRMKFDGGKVFNRCNRGAWNFRCYGAALRKNLGPRWAPQLWEKITGTPAGHHFHQFYQTAEKHVNQSLKNQNKPEAKKARYKRKWASIKSSECKKARLEYGEEAIDVAPDVSLAELKLLSDQFYDKHVKISEEMRNEIEKSTKSQSLSGLWIEERKKRLTASVFSDVVKRRPSIPVKALVQRLLYSNFNGTRLTRKGVRLEKYAVQEYRAFKKKHGETVSVQPMGLFISTEYPFVGATTDGLVESDIAGFGLLEIKHVLLNKAMTFDEASTKDKSFCLEKVHAGFSIKKNHKFYYQIQGQLNVMNYAWLDLVVRRVDPHEMHVERVFVDKNIWDTSMLPKLEAFYFRAILPELACPRFDKFPGIREPGLWFCADENKQPSDYHHVPVPVPPTVEKQAPPAVVTSPPPPVTSPPCKRKRIQKFLDRYISHEWIDEFGRSSWYSGQVINLLDGTDGHPGALYEILYDEFECAYEVDHLVEDFDEKSVRFQDL